MANQQRFMIAKINDKADDYEILFDKLTNVQVTNMLKHLVLEEGNSINTLKIYEQVEFAYELEIQIGTNYIIRETTTYDASL